MVCQYIHRRRRDLDQQSRRSGSARLLRRSRLYARAWSDPRTVGFVVAPPDTSPPSEDSWVARSASIHGNVESGLSVTQGKDCRSATPASLCALVPFGSGVASRSARGLSCLFHLRGQLWQETCRRLLLMARNRETHRPWVPAGEARRVLVSTGLVGLAPPFVSFAQ